MITMTLTQRRALAALIAGVLCSPAFAGAPLPTTTSITVLPTPVVLSGDASADAVFTTNTTSTPSNPTAVDAGKVNIEMATLAGVPSAVVPGIVWTDITGFAGPSSGAAQFAVDFDGLGILPGSTVGFRAHFVGEGGGAAEGKSDNIDVPVLGNTCSGFNVAADMGTGNGSPAPGDSGPWQFRITLENCTGVDLYNIKAQGGSNGWAPIVGQPVVSAGSAVIKPNKNNQIVVWNLDMPSGSTHTILVNVDGKIPRSAACESIRYLSGPWSAVYDAGAGSQKSDYTGRVSVTVTCPAP
jgi:hypothetical protein